MKINLAALKRFIPVIVGLFILPLFVQSARADEVDFVCGGTSSPILPCGGSISAVFASQFVLTSASDASTPITVVNTQGPELGIFFTLFFDTAAAVPNILLTNGVETLSGTILFANGFQLGDQDNVNLAVSWTTLPADFAAFLGSPTGIGVTTNVFLTTSDLNATSTVTITPVTPTPEPGSLLLLGSGLLSVGGLLRRRFLRA